MRLPWKKTGYPQTPDAYNIQASLMDMSEPVTCKVYRGTTKVASNTGNVALCMHVP